MQAGLSEGRARLLRGAQRTVALESISSTSKDGNVRDANELLSADAEDTASRDHNSAAYEHEQAL